MRRTFALVASAFVAAKVAAPFVIGSFLPALARNLFASALLIAIPGLAVSVLARAVALPLYLVTSAGRFRRCGSPFGWSLFAWLVKILPIAATMVTTPLAYALACFARLAARRGLGLLTFLLTIVMAVAIAIVARPAIVHPAAGTPDIDQFGLRWHCRRRGGLDRGDGLGGDNLGDGGKLCGGLGAGFDSSRDVRRRR